MERGEGGRGEGIKTVARGDVVKWYMEGDVRAKGDRTRFEFIFSLIGSSPGRRDRRRVASLREVRMCAIFE